MLIGARAVVGLVMLLSLLHSASLAGELTVIFDNGQARPISVFFAPLQNARRDTRPADAERYRLGAADLELLLPIRSAGLTPGKIEARDYPRAFARPFFLIGSDDVSKRWLVEQRALLKALGAVGLLVEASRVEDLAAIAELADGLAITPASGTDIAQAIGIAHYPVAISNQRIWQ